ncbi:MAG: hypothetical protein ACI8UO_001731 [Verrucomicrobiales bacterium]|jgi:hypothetical protein
MDDSTRKAFQILQASKQRLSAAEMRCFFADVRQLPEAELLKAYKPTKRKAKAKNQASDLEVAVKAELKKSKMRVGDFIGFMIERLDDSAQTTDRKWTLSAFLKALRSELSEPEIIGLAVRVAREESFAYDA